MNVRDLFEFESTLHGNRILDSPAEEQGVPLGYKLLRQLLDGFIQLQGLLDVSGRLAHRLEDFAHRRHLRRPAGGGRR